MAVLAVYLVLVLASYSSLDPSWSHSSSDPTVRNYGGAFGAWLSDMLLYVFGLSAWWLVVFCLVAIAWGYQRMETLGFKLNPITVAAIGGFLLLLFSSASIEAIILAEKALNLPLSAGGMFGHFIGLGIARGLGLSGAYLLLSVLAAIGFSLFTGLSWLDIMERLGGALEDGAPSCGSNGRHAATARSARKSRRSARKRSPPRKRTRKNAAAHRAASAGRAAVHQGAEAGAAILVRRSQDGALPGLTLLEAPKEQQEPVSQDTVEYTSRLIERKLADFGVDVKVVAAYPGPVITRYEVEPAVGVKGAQIVNLMKDLARALSLVSIRVVETIPGKTYMGLELPNPKRQIVRLSEIVGSDGYQNMGSRLTMALGKDIAGQPVSADLAKMPHVLVAGTTGSGKSVAINAMILSLLYKSTPKEVRLIMVDPKMLELSIYEGIPHLLAPVVTDMKQAANALNWCVAEMERRYKLMSAGRAQSGRLQPEDQGRRQERRKDPQSVQPDAGDAGAAGHPAADRGGDR